jgi:hypothetical protein
MGSDCKTSQIPWSKIRARIATAVPASVFAALNDLMSKPGVPDLFVASYAYGSLIVDNGEFRLPCQAFCPNCASLRREICENKSSIPIPLAGILDGCVEIFLEHPELDGASRQAPLQILRRSEMFGVFEALDGLLETPMSKPAWSISSGARSIWIIAPTGDARLSKELSKLLQKNINWNPDRHPHWKLVEAVVRNKHEWNTQLIVFSKKTVEAIKHCPSLFTALLQIGWKQSTRLRHLAVEDASLRSSLHRALQTYKVPQGELFQYVTIRHLLDLASGFASAYRVSAGTEEDAGPFKEFGNHLQAALDHMHLDYQPVVMQPGHLEKNGDVGYYSLRCPSVPGPRPHKFKESLAEVAGSYRDMLLEIQGGSSRALTDENLRFFVRPTRDDKNMPAGVLSSLEIPLSDFHQNRKMSKRKDIYLASPFFLAVARVTRGIGAQITVPAGGDRITDS